MVRGERGKHIHSEADMERIKKLHAKLFLDPATRLIGQNLRYDVQQYLTSFNINVVPLFPRYFDTMAAFHKLRFDKEKGLGHLTLLYTNMGPYWFAMEEWVEQNAGKKGLALFPGKKKQRFKHGYRDIIYAYLLPYAACDVDATFRIFLKLKAELELPGNEKLSDLFYKIDMPCNRFLHDIEVNGMPVVPEKLHELSDIYWKKIGELGEKLRELVGWQDFNPGSGDHKLAFLFSGSGPFKNHEKIAKVAANLKVKLGAPPVFTSGKFPKPWAKVPAKDIDSTGVGADRRVLKTLCGDPKYKDNEVLKVLSQYSEIVTFAKTFLAKPKLDEDIIALEQDPDAEDVTTAGEIPEVDAVDAEDAEAEANFVYGKGLIACTRRGNRISTSIDPLSETGRMKHRNPNMANLPKSKELNAGKVFGFQIPSVRDAFVARPGYVIMEADYSAAEVWTMAYLGNDKELLDLLLSGADIHTTNAKKFFNIGQGMTDDEFKEKHKAKRVAAKAVLFSVAYGTGAEGLAQRITLETGKHFPIEDAEQAINGFLTTYKGVAAYLARMKDDAINKEYVETPFGRRRYFPGISKLSREAQSAAKREGPNMTIQGTVADMLNSAGDTLWQFCHQTELGQEMDFKIMLAIHDAILVEVKEEYAPVMAQVLRLCMSDKQKIPVTSAEFAVAKLYVDVECGPSWGDLHKLKTFDKKTPFVKWCEANLSLLPPIAKERVSLKLSTKKVA
jgi:DNA polymerase I-like protein with 3'-5' exonuclease and polymerase domains